MDLSHDFYICLSRYDIVLGPYEKRSTTLRGTAGLQLIIVPKPSSSPWLLVIVPKPYPTVVMYFRQDHCILYVC
uniref:Uncharacterized protein n=1 Tax=Aegilops tauschii subsp. strangulata TaxID=200361 RepID=A0A453ISY3_AEGTS